MELSGAADAPVVKTHWIHLTYYFVPYAVQRGAPSEKKDPEHMSRRRRTPTKRPSVEIKFDCVPFNGTQGETYDKWERALTAQAGARADERGYSISDHLTGVDEGTPANPLAVASFIGAPPLLELRLQLLARDMLSFALCTSGGMRIIARIFVICEHVEGARVGPESAPTIDARSVTRI